MPDLEGFVISDKNRRAVFVELLAGENDIARATKRHRLIKPAVDRVVREFEERGIIHSNGDGGYALTEEGQRLATELKRKDLLS